MAESITLLGKRVEAFPIGSPVILWWRVNSVFFYAEVWGDGTWELWWNEVERLDGVADTPQAAADAIEVALRELVNGEWRGALEYLEGLRAGCPIPPGQRRLNAIAESLAVEFEAAADSAERVGGQQCGGPPEFYPMARMPSGRKGMRRWAKDIRECLRLCHEK